MDEPIALARVRDSVKADRPELSLLEITFDPGGGVDPTSTRGTATRSTSSRARSSSTSATRSSTGRQARTSSLRRRRPLLPERERRAGADTQPPYARRVRPMHRGSPAHRGSSRTRRSSSATTSSTSTESSSREIWRDGACRSRRSTATSPDGRRAATRPHLHDHEPPRARDVRRPSSRRSTAVDRFAKRAVTRAWLRSPRARPSALSWQPSGEAASPAGGPRSEPPSREGRAPWGTRVPPAD